VELAQRERERSLRSKSPLSLCLIDADNFKRINDEHGHVAGDHALGALARSARAALRAADVLGRLGGEEFAILLPDTELSGALVVAERVRATVEGALVQNGEGRSIGVTISVGVAQMQADESLEALLKRADLALYAAKDRGRNRVSA
jgi:diguanylate cyclase (GGDEF)-like protein